MLKSNAMLVLAQAVPTQPNIWFKVYLCYSIPFSLLQVAKLFFFKPG